MQRRVAAQSKTPGESDRRSKSATCYHTFQASRIATYRQNGGTLDHRHHESPPTTKLYDRTREELSFEGVERIRI
jgi:hypothetical protein